MLSNPIVGCFLALTAKAAAHGVVNSAVVNGQDYLGFGWKSNFGNDSSQLLAAWRHDNFVNYVGYTGNIPELNSSFQSDDMICNKNGTPGRVSIPIDAGQTIRMQWDNWPVTHHGPMTSYLANCKGPCETVNKTTLEFFKIDQVGLVNTTKVVRDGEGYAAPYLYSGTWGSDIMIGDGYTWDVVIPPDIKSGNYVLRHETIALHQVTIAGLNAQVYPSCWNLIIKGNGTATPSGISATKLYTANEPAMRFDIYNGTIAENPQLPPYPLPGPSMYKGAVEAVQTPPAAPTAEATGIRSSK